MSEGDARVLRVILLFAAVALFGIALYFGNQDPFRTASPSVVSDRTPYAIAPNITAGLASLGFALGGAFALLAAALVRAGTESNGNP